MLEAENCSVVINTRDYESTVIQVFRDGRELYGLEIIGAENVQVIR